MSGKRRVSFGDVKSKKLYKLNGLLLDIKYIKSNYSDEKTNKKLLTIMKRER